MAKQIVYMLSLVVFVWAYVFSTIDANPYQRDYNQGADNHLKYIKSRKVDDEDSHTKQAKLNAAYEDSYGKKVERNEENRDHALQKHKEADAQLEEKRNKYNRGPYQHSDKDSDSSDSNGYGSESRDDKYNRHPHKKYAGKGSDSDSSYSGDSNDYGSEHRDERVKRGAPEHGYHSSSRHNVPKSELHKKKTHLVENENEKDGEDVVNERYRDGYNNEKQLHKANAHFKKDSNREADNAELLNKQDGGNKYFAAAKHHDKGNQHDAGENSELDLKSRHYGEQKHGGYPESHHAYPAYEHHKKPNYGGHPNWNKEEVHEKKSAQEHNHHKEDEDEALKYNRRHGKYAPYKPQHKQYHEKKQPYKSKPYKSYSKPTTPKPTTQKPTTPKPTTPKPTTPKPTTQKYVQDSYSSED